MRIEQFRNLARSESKIEWIVEGLLSPGQWTYFVGPPGVGKSMMAIQLVDSLQQGKDFLGFPTTKHNCLYIQVDAGLVEWREQVRLLAGESYAWTMHEVPKGCLDESWWLEYMHSLVWGTYTEDDTPGSLHRVLKHVPFTFVVFDCLNALTDGDLNTKTCMSRILGGMEKICSLEIKREGERSTYSRVHFLLIHHPNATTTRGVNAGSGYKGFAGLCGNMLTLAGNVLVLEKNKITSKKEINLERNPNTGAWLTPSSMLGDSLGTDSLFDYEKALGISKAKIL